jgi:hypothetical protein
MAFEGLEETIASLAKCEAERVKLVIMPIADKNIVICVTLDGALVGCHITRKS